MAEWKHTTSAPSSTSMTSLGRALSRSSLSQPDVFLSQKSLSRSAAGQSRRRFSSSSEAPDNSPNVEARVLVINTGGTIGMTYHNNVLSPEPNALVETLRKLPILHDEQYAQHTRLYDYYKPQENTLVLPKSTHSADPLFHGSCSTGSIMFAHLGCICNCTCLLNYVGTSLLDLLVSLSTMVMAVQ